MNEIHHTGGGFRPVHNLGLSTFYKGPRATPSPTMTFGAMGQQVPAGAESTPSIGGRIQLRGYQSLNHLMAQWINHLALATQSRGFKLYWFCRVCAAPWGMT